MLMLESHYAWVCDPSDMTYLEKYPNPNTEHLTHVYRM